MNCNGFIVGGEWQCVLLTVLAFFNLTILHLKSFYGHWQQMFSNSIASTLDESWVPFTEMVTPNKLHLPHNVHQNTPSDSDFVTALSKFLRCQGIIISLKTLTVDLKILNQLPLFPSTLVRRYSYGIDFSNPKVLFWKILLPLIIPPTYFYYYFQIHKIIGFSPSLLQVIMMNDIDMPVRQAGKWSSFSFVFS